MSTRSWVVLLASFLLGAFPTAYLVARVAAGVDIRSVGDGNAGARNVYPTIGLSKLLQVWQARRAAGGLA